MGSQKIYLLTRRGSALKSLLQRPEFPDFDGLIFHITFYYKNNEFGRFPRLGKGGVLCGVPGTNVSRFLQYVDP